MGSLHGAIRRDLGTRRLRLRCVGNSMLPCWAAQNMFGRGTRGPFRRWDARMRSITQASKEKQQTKGGEASNACLQASKLLVANTLVLASLLACRPSWRVAVGGLVEVMRTFICALLDVSPRVRRLCVLPGWQRNVNVNERRTFRWDDLSNPKIPEKETG